MKLSFKIMLWFMLIPNILSAQSVNWSVNSAENNNIGYLNFGYDFGLTTRLGYGHKLKTFRPLWLNVDYSMPMGNVVFDDFKARLGGQMTVFNKESLILTVETYGNIKKHGNNLVQIVGFGSEIYGVAGYYKPEWHIAAKAGFDKSILTHLKHSEPMIENNPNMTNGWFFSSGGHWMWGIQASKTLRKKYFLSVDLGITNAQGKDENALLPFYFQLGLLKVF